MNGKTALILTAIIFLFSGYGCMAPMETAGPKPGKKATIELKVIPPDAVVIVDGTLVGNAFKIRTLELEYGVHAIEVRKEGYEPFSGTVDAGVTPKLEIELKKIE